MATQKAKSLLDEKNDGGSVIAGGSNTGLNSIDLGSPQNIDSMKPVDGDDTDKALAGGMFAYDPSGSEIVSKRVSTTLAGVSQDVLLSGAAQPGLRRQVHKIEGLDTSLVTTAIRDGHFNLVTGKFEAPYPSGQADSFGTDDAVTSNELQFKSAAPVPISADYGENNTTSVLLT